jgi:hypothetical protein
MAGFVKKRAIFVSGSVCLSKGTPGTHFACDTPALETDVYKMTETKLLYGVSHNVVSPRRCSALTLS